MKSLFLAAMLAFAPAAVLAQNVTAPAPPPAAAAPVDADPALWVVRDEDTTVYLTPLLVELEVDDLLLQGFVSEGDGIIGPGPADALEYSFELPDGADEPDLDGAVLHLSNRDDHPLALPLGGDAPEPEPDVPPARPPAVGRRSQADSRGTRGDRDDVPGEAGGGPGRRIVAAAEVAGGSGLTRPACR